MTRQLLRKVLDRERFVFYPQAEGATRWYDIGVTPRLYRFFAAVPLLKKPVRFPDARQLEPDRFLAAANRWSLAPSLSTCRVPQESRTLGT